MNAPSLCKNRDAERVISHYNKLQMMYEMRNSSAVLRIKKSYLLY